MGLSPLGSGDLEFLTKELMNLTFSRRTDLALAALHALAGAGGRKRTRSDLADEIGTTPSYLPQVIAPLARAGWVTSERGPGGGYRLGEAAFEARILDVIEAVEGPSRHDSCALGGGPCPESQCQMHAVWAEAHRILLEGFEDVPVLHSRDQGERT